MNDSAPVWFITGCSTGLGRALAATALERGHRVAAPARDPHTHADLVAGPRDRARALPLDVTQPAQIAEAVKRRTTRRPDGVARITPLRLCN